MTLETAVEIMREKQERTQILKCGTSEQMQKYDDEYMAIEVLIKHAEESKSKINDMECAIKDMQNQLWHNG